MAIVVSCQSIFGAYRTSFGVNRTRCCTDRSISSADHCSYLVVGYGSILVGRRWNVGLEEEPRLITHMILRHHEDTACHILDCRINRQPDQFRETALCFRQIHVGWWNHQHVCTSADRLLHLQHQEGPDELLPLIGGIIPTVICKNCKDLIRMTLRVNVEHLTVQGQIGISL